MPAIREVGGTSRGPPTGISVTNIVATSYSCPSLAAQTSPEHTVTVRPGFVTRPRARSRSPLPRREEVHFVLDRENLRLRWCQRHRRIVTGGIADRTHHAAVEETMLLTGAPAEQHLDLDPSRAHPSHRGTDRVGDPSRHAMHSLHSATGCPPII
jgi:hypothetical protein